MEKKSVLVVDDDKDLLKMLKLRLESEGFEFIGASSGKEMRATLKAKKPHLVILDIMLPEEDGFSVLRKLRKEEQFKDIPVIVLTAKERDKMEDLFALEDIAFFVEKPFQTEDLLKKIRGLVYG